MTKNYLHQFTEPKPLPILSPYSRCVVRGWARFSAVEKCIQRNNADFLQLRICGGYRAQSVNYFLALHVIIYIWAQWVQNHFNLVAFYSHLAPMLVTTREKESGEKGPQSASRPSKEPLNTYSSSQRCSMGSLCDYTYAEEAFRQASITTRTLTLLEEHSSFTGVNQ